MQRQILRDAAGRCDVMRCDARRDETRREAERFEWLADDTSYLVASMDQYDIWIIDGLNRPKPCFDGGFFASRSRSSTPRAAYGAALYRH